MLRNVTLDLNGMPGCRWSLGVLAFELVAGVPPFMHEDRMVMYRRIVDGAFTCPPHFSAVSARHVLASLTWHAQMRYVTTGPTMCAVHHVCCTSRVIPSEAVLQGHVHLKH